MPSGPQDYINKELKDGRKTVTAAGTAESLSATSVPCREITVMALESNNDVVVVGGSTVVAGTTQDGGGTRRGIALFPGQTQTIRVSNLSDVYIDVVTNGNGISFNYLT